MILKDMTSSLLAGIGMLAVLIGLWFVLPVAAPPGAPQRLTRAGILHLVVKRFISKRNHRWSDRWPAILARASKDVKSAMRWRKNGHAESWQRWQGRHGEEPQAGHRHRAGGGPQEGHPSARRCRSATSPAASIASPTEQYRLAPGATAPPSIWRAMTRQLTSNEAAPRSLCLAPPLAGAACRRRFMLCRARHGCSSHQPFGNSQAPRPWLKAPPLHRHLSDRERLLARPMSTSLATATLMARRVPSRASTASPSTLAHPSRSVQCLPATSTH